MPAEPRKVFAVGCPSRASFVLCGVIVFLLLVSALSGCVRRETLVVVPATMAAPASPLNRVEGDAYVLGENATVSARVMFHSVHRWGLSITARAEPARDGKWPQLRVALDGVLPRTIAVSDRRSIPYWFNFIAEPGMADLKLSLLNGAATAGPTLVIEHIEIVPL